MREPPSDRSEREQRCCISSDAEGHIWTSFPPLSHPLSIRPVPESFYRLEQFDSENTGTAIARVGRAISPVPPSQKAENAIWHAWVGQPSSPISSHVAIEGSRASLEHRVSPGVSEVQGHEQEPQEPQEPPTFLPPPSDFMVGELSYSSASLGEEIWPVSHSNPVQESSAEAGVDIQDQGSCATCEEGELNPEFPSDDNSSSQFALASPQTCTEAGEIIPDEAWKTFVFGNENSDEISRAAFEEAKHDVARILQPSDTPVPSSSSLKSSNIATVGTTYIQQDCQTSDSDSRDAYSPDGASSSQRATYDPSLAETGLDVPLSSSGVSSQPPSVEVNAGSSSPPQIGTIINTLETNELESPEQADISDSESPVTAPSMTTSMATSMAVVPAESDVAPSEISNMSELFRFSQPKLFVGSRSNLPHIAGHGVGPINPTKRRRGRPKKRANDGRADIRALPNYSSDPIEDFEEEGRVRKDGRVPESLFPALELT
ncbi:predicted protein [Chaetomium globosum CBS 148.51]|uniref:Uncharacterized protein n=1 Tax=Chaetomium globosum (strain ATCC 6205 / CBS 148.51 / DSM 1962 / NBRC 6347 / NRRL 1970) TaxID=306901 RepID=Q2GY25_CHAGB|nr:uncharacterized protein CHGG_07129 [Chaetomium globosum CBS 148.51]EAQ85876.1 predicted protein [Chaetomium globosum CBS 148.51]